MNVTVLLKSGPSTPEAARTFLMLSDMLSQGHTVNLWLLQDAVHLCAPGMQLPASIDLQNLLERNLAVHALKQDCSLRGIDVGPESKTISVGDYRSLVDLLESSDRVVGML